MSNNFDHSACIGTVAISDACGSGLDSFLSLTQKILPKYCMISKFKRMQRTREIFVLWTDIIACRTNFTLMTQSLLPRRIVIPPQGAKGLKYSVLLKRHQVSHTAVTNVEDIIFSNFAHAPNDPRLNSDQSSMKSTLHTCACNT